MSAGIPIVSWHRVVGAVALALCFALGPTPAPAGAALHDFAVNAAIPRRETWKYSAASLDPRSIQSIDENTALIASRNGKTIYLVHPTSREAVFGVEDYCRLFGGIPRTTDPSFFCAEMNGDKLLIVSRQSAFRVFEVERQGSSWRLNWVYGDGTRGYEPNQLYDPFFATYSDSGDVLIADDQGHRVLQVRVSDYDAAAPDNGFTDASIVWQFGEPGVEGVTGQLLRQPRSIEEMADGTMVILDSGNRAIRVRKTGPHTGEILWTYGKPGVAGSALGELNDPNRARILDNGNILISDGRNARVLEVDPSVSDPVKATVWVLSPTDPESTIVGPRDATRSSAGLTFVADSAGNQVVAVGYDTTYRIVSAPLDCGLPGVRKQFNLLSWSGSAPPQTAVRLEYSIDGGGWVYAGPANPWPLPAAQYGKLIRYRLTLTTSNRAVTPVVDSLTIDSAAAPASAVTDPDDTPTPAPTPETTATASPSSGKGKHVKPTDAATGANGVSLVPKNGGSAVLGGAGGDLDAGVEVFSGTLRGMAMAATGDGSSLGPEIGSVGAFSSGGTPGGEPVGAFLLLGGLYGAGLVQGALALRGLAASGMLKGRLI